MTIYLAGPINGCTDAEAKDWREAAKDAFHEAGHETLDPMRRDFRGREDNYADEIVEGDVADIEASDVFFAYCPQPSVGTSMEVLLAHQKGKFVVVCHPDDNPSPWLTHHADALFHDFDEAIDKTCNNVAEVIEKWKKIVE